MENLLFCETCGKVVAMSRELRNHMYHIKGEDINVEEEVFVCPVCGEESISFENAEKNEEEAYRIYRERKCLLSPNEIKHIRQKYGLSQGLFARILGLGEKTITRYENGYLPDPAQNNLIFLMNDIETFCILWDFRRKDFSDAEREKVDRQLRLSRENPTHELVESNFSFLKPNNFKLFLLHDKNENQDIDLELSDSFYYSWFKLKDELLYHNRYFPQSDFLDDLHLFFGHVSVMLPITANVTFYRAREKNITDVSYNKEPTVDYLLYHMLTTGLPEYKKTTDIIQILKNEHPDDARIKEMEEGFFGYGTSGSGIPPFSVKSPHGRANPEFISYLYLAEDPHTAISEIAPIPTSIISVALFKLTDSLRLIDLSSKQGNQYSNNYGKLLYYISRSFSSTAKNVGDYYITQYISEYIKNLGYDGIIFNSSICPEKSNLVLFYADKVKAIGSELYKVGSVKTTSYKIFPLEKTV